MKKKLLSIVSVLLMAATMFAGCSNDTSNQLKRIEAKGKIVIAMEGQWAPWTYHDETGALVGFDTELGRAIADELGVEVEFVEGEWDGLFVGLDSGKYDLIINGVDITEERALKYDFTEPYVYDYTALIVAQDNDEILSFEDLNGKTSTNSLGSTYADLAEKYGAKVVNVDTLAETMDMIISKRADATLNAQTSFLDYMKEQPDAPVKVVALTSEANRVAIPLRKGEGSAELRNKINSILVELRENGTLSELSKKYFGDDITKVN